MSKKEKAAPLDEEKAQQAAPAGEAAPEAPQGQEESFTLTKEQMEKMEGLAEQLAAQNDKYLRLAAEYDNYRKRNSASVSKAYADGAAEAVLKLLPVADNFGYALDSASDEKTKAGIDKVIKSFKNILSSLGIEEIEVEAGAPFDESVMEAVLNFPCGDGDAPNTVKQVLKKGYKAKEGKVIRYVQVAVTVEQ